MTTGPESSPTPHTQVPPGSTDRLQALHERLLAAVAELSSAEGWQQMLRTAAALPTYSPHNVLLITSQRPDARAVAGFQTWKQLGRSVCKGEKGIAILAPIVRRPSKETPPPAGRDLGQTAVAAVGPDNSEPPGTVRRLTGFRVVHVFDISQTDGPELPEPPRPIRLDGDAPAGLVDGLSADISQQGFQLIRHEFDIPHPGFAGANGVTDYFARTVLVRPDLSPAQTAKTLAHELGHVLLHGPGDRPPGLTRQQAEVEAESVAYIVTAAHGLDSSTYTVPYVAGWAGADPTLVATAAERVLSTAKAVLGRTPPAPTLALPEATREQLRDRQPAAFPDRIPDSGRVREAVPVGAVADRSRLTTRSQLAAGPSRLDVTAGLRGIPGRDDQGRLW
jgi:DNA primase